MGVNQNISGLERDGRALAIALKVLTRRFLGWRTRFESMQEPPNRKTTPAGLLAGVVSKQIT